MHGLPRDATPQQQSLPDAYSLGMKTVTSREVVFCYFKCIAVTDSSYMVEVSICMKQKPLQMYFQASPAAGVALGAT